MLDARKQRWLGSIRLPVARMGWPMAIVAFAALICLIALLAFGRYTRSERASGLLVPQGGLLALSAPANGTLLPEHAPLQAELWVSDRAIGLIEAGTPVVLRYAAFPYQTYGLQRGRVVEIASSASSPEEIRARTGMPSAAPAWRVLVALDRQSVGAHALQAQMRVDADLQLERRRLYEYVLAPLGLPSAQAVTRAPTQAAP